MSSFLISVRMLVVTVFLWGATLGADSSVLHADIVNESDRATVSSIELIKENEQLSEQIDNLLKQVNLYDQKNCNQKTKTRIASLALKAAPVSGAIIANCSIFLGFCLGDLYFKDVYYQYNKRGSYFDFSRKCLMLGCLVGPISFYVAIEKLVNFLTTRGQENTAKEITANLELLKKAFDELKADTQKNSRGETLFANSSGFFADMLNDSDRATITSIELIKKNEQLSKQLDNLIEQINLYDEKNENQEDKTRIMFSALKVSGSIITMYAITVLVKFGLLYIEDILMKSDWYCRSNNQLFIYNFWNTCVKTFILTGGIVSPIALYVAFEKLVDFLSTGAQKDKAKEIAAKLELLKKAFDELKADTV